MAWRIRTLSFGPNEPDCSIVRSLAYLERARRRWEARTGHGVRRAPYWPGIHSNETPSLTPCELDSLRRVWTFLGWSTMFLARLILVPQSTLVSYIGRGRPGFLRQARSAGGKNPRNTSIAVSDHPWPQDVLEVLEHRVSLGLRSLQTCLHSGGGRRKFTDAEVKTIRERYAAGEKQTDLAQEYGASQPALSYLCSKQRTRRGGYKHIARAEDETIAWAQRGRLDLSDEPPAPGIPTFTTGRVLTPKGVYDSVRDAARACGLDMEQLARILAEGSDAYAYEAGEEFQEDDRTRSDILSQGILGDRIVPSEVPWWKFTPRLK